MVGEHRYKKGHVYHERIEVKEERRNKQIAQEIADWEKKHPGVIYTDDVLKEFRAIKKKWTNPKTEG